MLVVLMGIALSKNPALHSIVHCFSLLYLVYGGCNQLLILRRKADWLMNSVDATQDEAWDYLYGWIISWLSSTVLYSTIVKMWWQDDFKSFTTMRKLDIIDWICILNAFTVILFTSIVEYWFTSLICNDWGLTMYFILAVSSRVLQAFYQGILIV